MGWNVYYQNIEDGKAWDVTSMVSAPRWKTSRKGSPASLTFTALKSAVVWTHGGIVSALVDGKGFFYGYVFRIKRRGGEDTVDITAYTQERYLKNKDTYVLAGKRADQVVRKIAKDLKLKTGTLANTKYKIPTLCEDNKSMYDIILAALDETLTNTGKMFYLWDDFGKLRLSSVADSKLKLFVGDGSMATGYSHESEIDTDTYNRIKLVRDNKDAGQRDVYIFKDSRNIKRWGTLQYFEKVNEEMNRAMIEQRGDSLLYLKNRPKQTMTIDAVADMSVRAGKALYVQFAELDIHQFMVVNEVTHNLEEATMQLKVMVGV